MRVLDVFFGWKDYPEVFRYVMWRGNRFVRKGLIECFEILWNNFAQARCLECYYLFSLSLILLPFLVLLVFALPKHWIYFRLASTRGTQMLNSFLAIFEKVLACVPSIDWPNYLDDCCWEVVFVEVDCFPEHITFDFRTQCLDVVFEIFLELTGLIAFDAFCIFPEEVLEPDYLGHAIPIKKIQIWAADNNPNSVFEFQQNQFWVENAEKALAPAVLVNIVYVWFWVFFHQRTTFFFIAVLKDCNWYALFNEGS